MNKDLIGKFKEELEKNKANLEKDLEAFATKDKNVEGNWEAKRINAEDTDMEEKADEVEEYDNLLSLEHSLELKLKDVNGALEKISAGTYGICEKCGNEIEEKRLQVCPEAKLCMKCNENR
jgi:RNA polymerase-binding transcription factor DksA